MSAELSSRSPLRSTRALAECIVRVAIAIALAACAAPPPSVPSPEPVVLPAAVDLPAQGVEPDAPESELPPKVPRPEFMSERHELPDLLLADKREHTYFTGFPAIGYDEEKGGQYGAVVQWYDNGSRDDPYFRSTPYRQSAQIGAVGGSENLELRLGYDHPYIFESPYRLRLNLNWQRSDVQRYFGVGDEGAEPLSFPGAPGETFDEYDDYKDALERIQDGTTWAKYDEYRSKDLRSSARVERDVLGGLGRLLAGIEVRKVEVDDYTGDVVDGVNADGETEPATEAPTHLYEDFQSGRISGFDGGWANFLKLGATYDTRDFEPDPASGVLGQVTAELATHWLGSDFDYQLVTTSLAGYYSPLPETTRLILAGRVLYSTQFGDVPFFAMNTLAFNSVDQVGLGGFHSLRGYHSNRFVGDSAALVNTELRWSPLEFTVFSQNLRLGFDGFYDTGRSFEGTALALDDWHAGYGFGLMLAWNLATVIRFDSAFSDEGQITYVEIGHSF